jgi:YVTN family beta-propeller protein
MDQAANLVYVVSASQYRVTNTIPVGAGPFKASQSTNGQYVYVLNGGSNTISIINGLTETVVGTAQLSSAPIDVSLEDLHDRIWVLQADGTVSVFDATTPGSLTLITTLPTITPAVKAATPSVYPTNLAVLPDGSEAYVGLGNTDTMVAINGSKLASAGQPTSNATTTITVGVHRSITQTLTYTVPGTTTTNSGTVPVELTTPIVNYVAVSRGGNTSDSADLFKAYASTTTSTTYYCYDDTVTATDCRNADVWDATPGPFLVAGCTSPAGNPNVMNCPNLYNGTAVVSAASNGTIPVNTYITTIPSPFAVTYCNVGNPETGEYDGNKNCPAMIPVGILGRS